MSDAEYFERTFLKLRQRVETSRRHTNDEYEPLTNCLFVFV